MSDVHVETPVSGGPATPPGRTSLPARVGAAFRGGGAWLLRLAASKLFAWSVLAIVVLGVFLSFFQGDSDNRNTIDDVANQWNKSIRQFGIDPIYPLQEEMYVGDVLIRIVDDKNNADNPDRYDPIVERTFKIDHINVVDQLRSQYSSEYIFPDSTERPVDGSIWKQNATSDKPDLFLTGKQLIELPLLMLPGIDVVKIRKSSGGFSALLRGIGGAIGLARDSAYDNSISIPLVETYGLYERYSYQNLVNYCSSDSKTQLLCMDFLQRRIVSSMVGEKIYEHAKNNSACRDRDAQGKKVAACYRFGLELLVIDRVYLTRAIDFSLQDENGMAASAAVSDKLNDLLAKTSAPDNTNGAPVPKAPIDVEREQQAILAKVNGLVAALGSQPGGGSITSVTANGRAVTAKQTFQRPLAFGYRAVRFTSTEGEPKGEPK